MTVQELIEELEKIEDQNLEVKIMNDWEEFPFPILFIREEDLETSKVIALVF